MIFPAQYPLIADAILETVANTCLQLDIPYFLSYGTCLGLYRDGAYIPTDNDLDFSMVYSQEGFDGLAKHIQDFGFLPDIGNEWEGVHFWKYGILADFHWVYAESYYAQHEQITYRGYKYHVPSPVEGYLAWLYGEDWRTPKEGFQQLRLGKDLQVKYGRDSIC